MTSHSRPSATIESNSGLRNFMSDLITPIPRTPHLDESIQYVNKVFATQPLRQLSARQQPQHHQPQFRTSPTLPSNTTAAANALSTMVICPQSGCRKVLSDRLDLRNHLLTHSMQPPLLANSSTAQPHYGHSKARRNAPSRLSSISENSLGRELVASNSVSAAAEEENRDSADKAPRKHQYPGHALRRTTM
ncbi:hypothetical protein BJ741DRAFT_592858 [Chytriomyces cf. hyalinus JEL632]|nr:hypothetical protein BJ741DRAFT_592858 [Chytriomyces cf. hyalinus JEL632]